MHFIHLFTRAFIFFICIFSFKIVNLSACLFPHRLPNFLQGIFQRFRGDTYYGKFPINKTVERKVQQSPKFLSSNFNNLKHFDNFICLSCFFPNIHRHLKNIFFPKVFQANPRHHSIFPVNSQSIFKLPNEYFYLRRARIDSTIRNLFITDWNPALYHFSTFNDSFFM